MNKFSMTDILNANSQAEIQGQDNIQNVIENIHISKLINNPENFYNVSDLEPLKSSIALKGILQPLIVRRISEDQFLIIAGHRRAQAVRELLAADLPYKILAELPCLVLNEIDEVSEKIIMIQTNSTTRELSPLERITQVQILKDQLLKYKKINKLPGRVRDMVANALGVSPSTIQNIETIDEKLSPEFKQELEEGNITMQTAAELAKKSPDEQAKELEKHVERDKKTTIKDVKKDEPKKEQDQPAIKKPVQEPKQYKEVTEHIEISFSEEDFDNAKAELLQKYISGYTFMKEHSQNKPAERARIAIAKHMLDVLDILEYYEVQTNE